MICIYFYFFCFVRPATIAIMKRMTHHSDCWFVCMYFFIEQQKKKNIYILYTVLFSRSIIYMKKNLIMPNYCVACVEVGFVSSFPILFKFTYLHFLVLRWRIQSTNVPVYLFNIILKKYIYIYVLSI